MKNYSSLVAILCLLACPAFASPIPTLDTVRSLDEPSRTYSYYSRETLVTPWREEVTIFLTNDELGSLNEGANRPFAATVISKDGKQHGLLSTSYFKKFLENGRIKKLSAEILLAHDVPLNERLDAVAIAESKGAYDAKACSQSQLIFTMIKLMQLQRLKGDGAAPDYLNKINSMRQVFTDSLVTEKACKQLIPIVLYTMSADSELTLEPYRTGPFYALAVLYSHTSKTCEEYSFIPNNTDPRTFECIRKFLKFPGAVTAEDVVLPLGIYNQGMAKYKADKEVFSTLANKLIETGIYNSEFISYVVPSTSTAMVRLSVGGKEVGEFSSFSVHPLLIAEVKIGTCRNLLTLEGVQRYCLSDPNADRKDSRLKGESEKLTGKNPPPSQLKRSSNTNSTGRQQ